MLPRRAYLGAELPADHEAFVDAGVRLAAVTEGGMAAAAGLQAGDLVRSIAGVATLDLCTLTAALRAAGAAAEVEVSFVRAGIERRVQAAVAIQPCEPGADYGEFAVAGARLRTITTRITTRITTPITTRITPPITTAITLPSTPIASPRAVIAVIQGIACESVDHALTPETPLAVLITSWAAAGYEVLRFDKRGVGDSEGGPCHLQDFRTERDDARAALALAEERARTRGVPLFVFGHSVGGIITALLAPEVPLAGAMVYGTPVMRWLACLKDSTQRQLALRGAPDDEIAGALRRLDGLAERGELNGRSARYHRELDALDGEAAWQRVTVPTLVLRGEHDWVVRADDQARIAALAAGPATLVDLPGLDHLFGWHPDREASLRDYGVGVADPQLGEATLAWLAAHT